MIRIMYDAIGQNSAHIPADADIVAGYSEGDFAWTPEDWARYPKAAHARIATLSDDYQHASVVDSELHALPPAACRTFVIERNKFRPGTATVYRDWAGLPQLLRACAGLSYDLWLAWWIGGVPHSTDLARVRSVLPAGVNLVAWQWANRGTYDVSAVFDDDWHPEPRS